MSEHMLVRVCAAERSRKSHTASIFNTSTFAFPEWDTWDFIYHVNMNKAKWFQPSSLYLSKADIFFVCHCSDKIRVKHAAITQTPLMTHTYARILHNMNLHHFWYCGRITNFVFINGIHSEKYWWYCNQKQCRLDASACHTKMKSIRIFILV